MGHPPPKSASRPAKRPKAIAGAQSSTMAIVNTAAKTSTGFAGGGATLEDIQLFRKYVTGDTKIKAAGGIKSVADAEAFLAAGADRLGTSSLLAMLKQEESSGP